MNITWTAFYQEFADVLLKYKDNRKELIGKIEDIYDGIDLSMPTLEKDNKLVDIDPFTIFGMFNKGLTDQNRKKIIGSIKSVFDIDAPMPDDFNGIPVLNNMSATFYDFIDGRTGDEFDNLWALFEIAIKHADTSENLTTEFKGAYDTVFQQKGVKRKLTMGLYWIRPYYYVNLDSRNTEFIIDKGIADKKYIQDAYADGFMYLNLCQDIKNKLIDNEEYSTLPELSNAAWLTTKEKEKMVVADSDAFWPALSEYNPGVSKEMWIEYINEIEKPEHPLPMKMLKGILELGGQASCKQLAEAYGGSAQVYVGCTVNLGKRAKKYFGISGYKPDNRERLYVIPFQGKETNDGTYIYKIRPELEAALNEIDLSDLTPYYNQNDKEEGIEMASDIFSKNTILYGPPGTGKTYNSAIYAVAICDEKSIESAQAMDYDDVMIRYKELVAENRVAFTTFHQSYGYEEFIEGIRPVMDNSDDDQTDIKYQIMPGLFKAFCDKAGRPVLKQEKKDIGLNNSPTIWKVSLEGTGDNPTRTECMENGHIRVGYDSYGENITSDTNFSEGGKTVLNAFVSRMKVGDIVLSCYSSTTIDAIGVVTGEYEWHDEYDNYKRLRNVNWIVKGIREDITEINNGASMTLASVYRLNISISDVMNLISKYAADTTEVEDEKKNYVFIIDEINRGNISKIFGELITLIEETKRIGQDEGMKVKLPYSQQTFGVPDNVYILGTMNTADRSIALMDTALRRRFEFVEMMPDADVLRAIGADKVEDLDVAAMFEKINERITFLYDREHTIGHAFFTKLAKDPTVDTLKSIFEKSVIPLLQEYFYEDYQKIQLVLGDNGKSDNAHKFILDSDVKVKDIFKGNADDVIDLPEKKYTINPTAFDNLDSYKEII